MNRRKIIVPIIITLILILYFSFLILGILSIANEIVFKILATITPLVLIGFSISALIDRIKEIRSGEEDDLSKYWLYSR